MDLIDALRRVCALQRQYASQNTPEMQERGQLVRQVLPLRIRDSERELRAALGEYGGEFNVQASDGIGRKTEAPWVRFFAESMSPNPRDGFYVVIHFAADGSAVFVTLGCGSTIWADGSLKAISDAELKERTDWARQVIRERFGSTSPFDDQIALGARAKLPRTFEKATAVAKRLSVDALDEREFRDLLVQAGMRLRDLYEAQRTGRHLKATAVAELELEAISRPSRAEVAGQGFRLSPDERKAIELRAMEMAKTWLEQQGYSVADKSMSASYDFEATKGDAVLKIEVKGTTGDGDGSFFMTKNEVDLHRSERGSTGIIVVSGIELRGISKARVAVGGRLFAHIGWDIGTWEVTPMAFKVVRLNPARSE